MNSGLSYVHKETLVIVSRYELTHFDVEAIVELHGEGLTYDDFIADPDKYAEEIKEYLNGGDYSQYMGEDYRDEIDYDWWIESE